MIIGLERKSAKGKSHKRKFSLPKSLSPFFPEYRFPDLRLGADKDLIICRTLEYGSQRELRWLFDAYGEMQIKEVVQRRGYRSLSLRSFLYWREVLGIHHFRKPPWLKDKSVFWRY